VNKKVPIYEEDRIDHPGLESVDIYSAIPDDFQAMLNSCGQWREPDETRLRIFKEEFQNRLGFRWSSLSRRVQRLIPQGLITFAVLCLITILILSSSGVVDGSIAVVYLVFGAYPVYTVILLLNERNRVKTKLKMLESHDCNIYALSVTQKMWCDYYVRGSDSDSSYTIEGYYIQCGGLTLKVSKNDYIKIDKDDEIFVAVFNIDGKIYADLV